MVVEPKVLEPGWIKRCGANTLKLILRNPLGFVATQILPMALSTQTQSFLLLIFLAVLSLVAGTVVAFKSDSLQDKRVLQIVNPLIAHPYLLLFTVVSVWLTVWARFNTTLLRPLLFSDAISLSPYRSGMEDLLMCLALVSLFTAIVTLILRILHLLLPKVIAFRTSPFCPLGLFSAHLTLHHQLPMTMAGELSAKATGKNRHPVLVMAILVGLCLTLTPLMCVVPYFMYCLYLEVFEGTGLAREAPAAATSTSIDTVTSPS